MATPTSDTIMGNELVPMKAKLNWTIHNFSFFKESTEIMYSEELQTGNIVWRLSLRPFHKVEKDDTKNIVAGQYTEVYLHFRPIGETNHAKSKLSVQARFRIVRPLVFGASLPLYFLSYNHTFLPGQNSWGYEKFATHTQLFGTGPTSQYFLKHTGDKLFLQVDIKYLEMDSTATMPAVPKVIKKIPEIDFRAMYETGANSDFILVFNDGTQKKVRRNILVTRSKFFGELFAGQSKAVQEGQYNMAVSTAVLEAMLKFMYYRGTEDMVKYGKDLLLAAVEYKMEDLKTACEAVLVARVTMANAQEMEDLAAKLDLVGLRDAVKRVRQA